MKKIKAISLTVTILIMALIFFFSSQTSEESTDVSDGITMKIVEILYPQLDVEDKVETAEELSHLVRKAAHFMIFAALGLSVATTVKAYCSITNGQAIIRAMAICVAYACSDEIHQNFVSGRTMKFSDVLIDSAGALVGIGMFFLLYKACNKFIRGMKKERYT